MIMTRQRAIPAALILAGMLAAFVSLTALSAIAHGDTGSAGPVVERVLVQTPAITVEAPPANIATIIALILGALGAASGLLHFIAPRTPNKVDDALSAKVDELLALFKLIPLPVAAQAAPSTVVNVAAPVSEPRSADGKFGAGTTMIALFLLGMVATQPACSGTTGQRAANGTGAFLDCQSPNIDLGLLTEAKGVTKSALMKWFSGAGHVDTAGLKSEAAPLKSDLMRCAFDAAVAAWMTPAKPSAIMAAGLEVDADELRAAYAQTRVELGWPVMKAAGG
jgi:hypothetical protein